MPDRFKLNHARGSPTPPFFPFYLSIKIRTIFSQGSARPSSSLPYPSSPSDHRNPNPKILSSFHRECQDSRSFAFHSSERRSLFAALAMALSASDVQTLYSMLLSSLSPEVSERSPAESALSQCESRPGFCSCLLVPLSYLALSGVFLLGFGFVFGFLGKYYVCYSDFFWNNTGMPCRKSLLRGIWVAARMCVSWHRFTSRTALIDTGGIGAIQCKLSPLLFVLLCFIGETLVWNCLCRWVWIMVYSKLWN